MKRHVAGLVLDGAADPAQVAFYRTAFGMTARRHVHETRLAFGSQRTYVALRDSKVRPYRPTDRDRFWKIGVTVPDVDIARATLVRRGIEVSEPQQFRDIGYLCHLRDPAGVTIELLQHTFAGAPLTAAGDPTRPLGGRARLGQITLRSNDIARDLAHYRDSLGMSLLSVQPVRQLGFTLYFLAFTNERPPSAEPTAVENRPWLWQRPYTTLEIQHFDRAAAPIAHTAPGHAGFAGIRIEQA